MRTTRYSPAKILCRGKPLLKLPSQQQRGATCLNPPEIRWTSGKCDRRSTCAESRPTRRKNLTASRSLSPALIAEYQTQLPDKLLLQAKFSNRGGLREVQGYGAPPTSRDAKPPTEAERNAAGYFSRMDAAGRELDALTNSGYDPTNMRDRYTAGQGPLKNWAASEEGQNYRQQQEDWVRAKLRKESGAVIGDEEMAREISTYFPEAGDKPPNCRGGHAQVRGPSNRACG